LGKENKNKNPEQKKTGEATNPSNKTQYCSQWANTASQLIGKVARKCTQGKPGGHVIVLQHSRNN